LGDDVLDFGRNAAIIRFSRYYHGLVKTVSFQILPYSLFTSLLPFRDVQPEILTVIKQTTCSCSFTRQRLGKQVSATAVTQAIMKDISGNCFYAVRTEAI
jgi:hypothetical protein